MATGIGPASNWEFMAGTSEVSTCQVVQQRNYQQHAAPQFSGNSLMEKPVSASVPAKISLGTGSKVHAQSSGIGKKMIQPKLIAVPLKAFAGSLSLSNLSIPGSHTAGQITTDMKSGQPMISLILNSTMKAGNVQIGNQQSVPIFLASSAFSAGTLLQPIRISSFKSVVDNYSPDKLKKVKGAKAGKKAVQQEPLMTKQENDGEITFLKEIPNLKKSGVPSRPVSLSAASPVSLTTNHPTISVSKIVLPQSLLLEQNCQRLPVQQKTVFPGGKSKSSPNGRKKFVKEVPKVSPKLPPGIKLERIQSTVMSGESGFQKMNPNTFVTRSLSGTGNAYMSSEPNYPQFSSNSVNNMPISSCQTSQLASMTLKAFACGPTQQSGSNLNQTNSNSDVEYICGKTERYPPSYDSEGRLLNFQLSPDILAFGPGSDVVDSPRCPPTTPVLTRLPHSRFSVPPESARKQRRARVKPKKHRKQDFLETWRDPALDGYKKLVHEVSPLERILERDRSRKAAVQRVLPKGPLDGSDSDEDEQPQFLQQRLDLTHCPSQTGSSRRRGSRLARELTTCGKQSLSCLRNMNYLDGLDLVGAVRQEPLETVRSIPSQKKLGRNISSNRAKLRLYSKKRCMFLSEEDTPACDSFALPCSNLCRSHIFQSESQVLFEPCIGVDNIPCGVPAVPGLCDVSLCADHFASVGKSLSRRVPRHKWKKRGRPSSASVTKESRVVQRGRKPKELVIEAKRQTKAMRLNNNQLGINTGQSKKKLGSRQTAAISRDSISDEVMEIESIGNQSDRLDDEEDLADAFPTEAFRGMFENGGISGESIDEALEELAGYNVSSDLFDLLSDSAFADAMLSRGIETLGDDDLNESDFCMWDSVSGPETPKGYSDQLLRVQSPVPAASPPGIGNLISETSFS